MDKALTEALIRLGLLLAERVLIPALERLVAGSDLEPEAADNTVLYIVAGIQQDHPELDGPGKRAMAYAAIEQLFRSRGANPTARDINLALEVAVARLKESA